MVSVYFMFCLSCQSVAVPHCVHGTLSSVTFSPFTLVVLRCRFSSMSQCHNAIRDTLCYVDTFLYGQLFKPNFVTQLRCYALALL